MRISALYFSAFFVLSNAEDDAPMLRGRGNGGGRGGGRGKGNGGRDKGKNLFQKDVVSLMDGNCYWGEDDSRPLLERIKEECNDYTCGESSSCDARWQNMVDQDFMVEGCPDEGLTDELKEGFKTKLQEKKEIWTSMSKEERKELKDEKKAINASNVATVLSLGCGCCGESESALADLVRGKEGAVARTLRFRKPKGKGLLDQLGSSGIASGEGVGLLGQLGSGEGGEILSQLGNGEGGGIFDQLGSGEGGGILGQLGSGEGSGILGQLGNGEGGGILGQLGSGEGGGILGQLGSGAGGGILGQLGNGEGGGTLGQLGSGGGSGILGQLGNGGGGGGVLGQLGNGGGNGGMLGQFGNGGLGSGAFMDKLNEKCVGFKAKNGCDTEEPDCTMFEKMATKRDRQGGPIRKYMLRCSCCREGGDP